MLHRLAGAARAHPMLLAILGLSLLLNGIGLSWGLPGVESWMADSVAGELSLKVWATYWLSSHKYPYLHGFLNFLAYGPLLIYWLATGQLDGGCWPYLKAKCFETDAFVQLGSLILISRAISALMGTATVWLTWRLARAVGASSRAALLAALGAACSLALVLYSHLGTLDGPVTFWYTLSLLAFIGILKRGRVRDYAAFGLSSGAALGTKEGVIGAYVLTALAILWAHGTGPRQIGGQVGHPTSEAGWWTRLRALSDRRLLSLVGGLVLVYGLSTNPVFNWAGFVEHWQQWLPSHGRMAGYQSSLGLGEAMARAWRKARLALDLPFLLLALTGLAHLLWRRLRRRERDEKLALALAIPSLSYLGLSVLLSRIVEVRVFLPLVPVLALYAGLLGDRLLRAAAGHLRPAILALLALVYVHAGLHALNHDLLMLRDSRYAAEDWLRQAADTETRILAYGDSRYLPRLDWLGLDARWDDPDAPPGPQLQEIQPELVLLSSRWIDRFEEEPEGDFFSDLRAGRLGYEVVFDHRSELPLRWSMDPMRASGSIAPRITILRKVGAGALQP